MAPGEFPHTGHSCEAPDPREWKFPQRKFSVYDVGSGGQERVRWKAVHLSAILSTSDNPSQSRLVWLSRDQPERTISAMNVAVIDLDGMRLVQQSLCRLASRGLLVLLLSE